MSNQLLCCFNESLTVASPYLACEQAPGEDRKNFGEHETEEFGEQSDRGGHREPVRRLRVRLIIFFSKIPQPYTGCGSPYQGIVINI